MSDNIQSKFSRDIRDRAHFLRYSTIESLETHLLALESRLIENKMEVRWAQDESNLCNTIIDLFPQKQYNRVCFDLPYIPEELKNCGDNVINYLDVNAVANHENEAETLVVDADFAVAENGSFVFLDKKSKNCFNLVKNIIIVLSIDQIIVSQSDLSFFLKLKARNGEEAPKDVKILSGSFNKINADEFLTSDALGFTTENVNISVILYENNVSDILEDVSLRQSLYCIHCGRCLDVCPVAKCSSHISPIEVVKRNCFDQFNRTQSIFQQTTLCGNCEEVCPVGIPLSDLLIYEMNLVNGNVNYGKTKKLYSVMSRRNKLNKYNHPIMKMFFVRKFFGKNKMLMNYFLGQKDPFFNVTRNTPQEEDDQPKF